MKKTALVFLALCLGFPVLAERFVPRSDLIPKVLEVVHQGYVDQNRVQPMKMLEGALEHLSSLVAPVMTQVTTKGGLVSIEIKVDQHSKTIETQAPKTVKDLNKILQEVSYFVKLNLEKGAKPEEVDYALINGFLRRLDPHTMLLVPEVYSDFSTSTTGNFGGVGMMIGLRKGDLTVIAPIDGTPASRAGLRAKDRIVQIDDESTINMPLTDAVDKLRGEIGTQVVIYIERDGLSAPKKVVLTRDLIKITSVESHVFEENGKRVGYIQLKTFQKNTIEELNEALDEMDYDLKSFRGVILDLRNNPGGLLAQAIQVSDRFLNKGVIVSTAGLDAASIQTYKAHWFSDMTETPLIVLINSGSASASEIVAAALKKNQRAVVMGTQSFGKGSVQQVIPLPDGSALKITTQKYLTPGNLSIQSVGVSPHIEVDPYYVSEDFVRVTPQAADGNEDSLEENFKEWGDKDQAEAPEQRAYYLYQEELKKLGTEEEEEPAETKEAKLEQLKKDFLVQSSLQILLKNEKNDFAGLLKEGHRYMTQEEKEQEKKLTAKFGEFKTDWSVVETKGAPKLEALSWVELKKGEAWEKWAGPVPAKSQVRLYLSVKNQGAAVSRLIATSKSKNPVFDNRQFAFGSLKSGESKSWFVPAEIGEGAISRNDKVVFEFTDASEKELASYHSALAIAENIPPTFAYRLSFKDQGPDTKGNGNGLAEPGETLAVEVEVTNQSTGTSGPLTLLLKNGEGERVFLKKGRLSLPALKSGESGKASFLLEYKSKPLDGNLDFSFDLLDGTYPLASVNEKLKLSLDAKDYQVSNQLPSFTLENFSNTSGQKKVRIKGQVSDLDGVKDVYAYVENKKVYYQNFMDLKEQKKVEFSFEVDLGEDNNRVILLSRDQANVAGQKTLYIRYEAAK
ncbi:MAG: hypothetical protein A2600_07225 [Candidatus Lambdaproteobacteria bacterium RIFOXYD1_FULL_56_27]|uniref:PDZ domain-containing protein n=1 Tax=Candidatus Lambdaproteobacteria bacterium RIFOXYD2_FULL_56_26 TaxID=1817773 RepID=A0A1F6GQA8_9PROT|nr:MAG: hypothetical protein A2557_05885 [Candidatus Lambdaproteobacteria bacterium RIFOXYD2_FULL_56_26]OGH03723.1 MAG: hypothetical protein A2426_00675 [Candidatus Lambdaproteobacteria bacterium RIFOXYC1_FULL_56_13]OGH07307.1 MAG: hypothetical protein A2600_07225 [Candidatus Lambdaproteobacteria bacterium RIFOXYD1_FULL_56_27]